MKKASHMVVILMWALNFWTTIGIRSEKKIKNLDFQMDFKEKASSIPDRTQDYIAYKLLVLV